MYCQTIQSVRDIYRDDRARIATCTLRTLTERHKENYSIDYTKHKIKVDFPKVHYTVYTTKCLHVRENWAYIRHGLAFREHCESLCYDWPGIELHIFKHDIYKVTRYINDYYKKYTITFLEEVIFVGI